MYRRLEIDNYVFFYNIKTVVKLKLIKLKTCLSQFDLISVKVHAPVSDVISYTETRDDVDILRVNKI